MEVTESGKKSVNKQRTNCLTTNRFQEHTLMILLGSPAMIHTNVTVLNQISGPNVFMDG